MYSNLIKYLGFNLVVLIVGFAMLPLISNVISPEEYGEVAIFLAIVALIQPVVGMSCESLVQVKKHQLLDDEFTDFLSNLYLVSFVLFLISELCLQLYFSLKGEKSVSIFWILPVLALIRFLINVRLMEYTIEGRSTAFGVTRLSVKLFSLITLLACLLFSYDLKSDIYIWILVLSEIAVMSFLFRGRQGVLLNWSALDKRVVREIIVYGLPLVFAVFPLWILNEYGKFLLKEISFVLVGYFFFAKQLSMVYVQVSASVSNAFINNVLSSSSKKDLMRVFLLSSIIYLVILIVYAVSFGFLSIYVVGERFSNSDTIFYVLLIGGFFQVLATIPSQLIAKSGKTKYQLTSSVVSCIIFLISSSYFFEEVSTINVAYSFSLGMASYSLSMWVIVIIRLINVEFSD